jgi:hypothetical protein
MKNCKMQQFQKFLNNIFKVIHKFLNENQTKIFYLFLLKTGKIFLK